MLTFCHIVLKNKYCLLYFEHKLKDTGHWSYFALFSYLLILSPLIWFKHLSKLQFRYHTRKTCRVFVFQRFQSCDIISCYVIDSSRYKGQQVELMKDGDMHLFQLSVVGYFKSQVFFIDPIKISVWNLHAEGTNKVSELGANEKGMMI